MRRVQRLQSAASSISSSYSASASISTKFTATTCARRSLSSTSEAKCSRLSSTRRFTNGLAWSSGRVPVFRRCISTTGPRAASNEVKPNAEPVKATENPDSTPAEDPFEIEEGEPTVQVAESDLKLPPREIQRAPRPADATKDVDYIPAEEGFGLEEVGGLDGWFEDESNWSQSKVPAKFGPEEIETSPAALEKILETAVLEAAAETEKETSGIDWRSYPLNDMVFKFKVAKSLQSQSGHRIPDGTLLKIQNGGQLLSFLVRAPKAKKLAEELETKGTLQLPNVKLYDRRVTPVDKEKMVGRWKVIVKELEKRKLPVLGTGEYGESIETKWAVPNVPKA